MKVDQKIIDQIVELKSRQLKRTGRVDQVHKRLIPISDAYKLLASRDISNRQVRTELLRYIPVSLVACIEGYFTLAIKDIVDGGPPKELIDVRGALCFIATRKMGISGVVVAKALNISRSGVLVAARRGEEICAKFPELQKLAGSNQPNHLRPL